MTIDTDILKREIETYYLHRQEIVDREGLYDLKVEIAKMQHLVNLVELLNDRLKNLKI